MLIPVILIISTYCTVVTSKDIPPTHQITIQFSQLPTDTLSFKYQEDLTSTINFLKEEPPNKKNKVTGLIKVLKKVLTKYIDELKENEETTDCNPNVNTIEIENDFEKNKVTQNDTVLDVTERTIVEEFINDHGIVEQVKSEKIIQELYEIKTTTEKLNLFDDKMTYIAENKADNKLIPMNTFVEDDLLNYIQNFRSKSICRMDQQESNVLERPEPKLDSPFAPKVEKPKRNPKSKRKSSKKKKPFHIPCVKASDILQEQPKYEAKVVYPTEHIPVIVSSDTEEIKTTLESPLKNEISCSDSDGTVALLFKPKTISLMQAYGNLLKKITVTVLVPFHVTKLAV